MKPGDKFLVVILGGITLLVILIGIFVLTRPEPTYKTEDTPEGVVYNYLLALENGDYERALSYISVCVKNRPSSAGELSRLVENSRIFHDLHSDTSLYISSSEITDDGIEIEVQQTRFDNAGPFDNSVNHDNFVMLAINEAGEWKLVDGEDYWRWNWTLDPLCP